MPTGGSLKVTGRVVKNDEGVINYADFQGVVCLISALEFHELTTQMPYEVFRAFPQNTENLRGFFILPCGFSGLQVKYIRKVSGNIKSMVYR